MSVAQSLMSSWTDDMLVSMSYKDQFKAILKQYGVQSNQLEMLAVNLLSWPFELYC